MKKLLMIFACVVMVSPITACKSKSGDIVLDVNPPISAPATPAPGILIDPTDANANGEIVITAPPIDRSTLPTWDPNAPKKEATFVEADSVFKFSDAEKFAYENFPKAFDKSLFKDLAPISIFKIYIQYGISSFWEAEYEMYSKTDLKLSKEDAYYQYAADARKDETGENKSLSKKDMAEFIFSKVDEGVFVEDSPTTGHIEFKDADSEDYKFQFIKNADGIWEPVFNSFS